MVDWLVLGSSSLGYTLVESLLDRPGSVSAVVTDESRAKALREIGIAVELGDPSVPANLRELPAPDMVVVAADTADRNRAVAAVARRVFPDSYVIATAGEGGRDAVASLTAVTDQVIDSTAATADVVVDRADERGLTLQQLRQTLSTIDRLAVLTHDNPDPDAIASAIALARLSETLGTDAEVCYYGDIAHQENRAFVNLLNFDLRNLDPGEELAEFDGIALVDHSRSGVNDQLPEDTPIDIVIDHHPPRAPVEARFVDLRSSVGATSTLLVEYLDRFGIGFDEDVATGLLFGIRVDTQAFTRETSGADFEAAARVLPHAELGTLERIESPSISPDTFDTIAEAIHSRRREGDAVVSCVGYLSDRDALAQAADRLLMLEEVTTTVVFGVRDEMIYVSARTRGAGVDLGEVLRAAYGQIGSAGGHADMAGAQIPVGFLDAEDEEDHSPLDVVETLVAEQFLEAYETHSAGTRSTTTTEYDADKYLIPDEQFSQSDEPDT